MSNRSLAALLAATLAATLGGAAGSARPTPLGDPLDRLQAWVGRAQSAPRSIDTRRKAELRDILAELRLGRAARDDVGELDRALIELASLEWRAGTEAEPVLLASARLARAELEAELTRASEPLATRLAEDVLDPASKRPRAERLVAVKLLQRVHATSTLKALRAAARESDLDLARAGLEALSGWPDPLVHLFFLEELERGAPCARVAAEHFQATQATLGEAVLEHLRAAVATRYFSEDWREAARARGLARALDLARTVPILIEALAVWERRTAAGAKRIRGEIWDELKRLSGRSIEADPAHWSAWWEGVREGRIALPAELAAAGDSSTSASFFGLHAVTDRVVFVVDRSGSMATGIGTGGRTRYEEAAEQMVTFLRRSGSDTRFTVALFSKDGFVWRSNLQPASEGNLEQARRWLAGNPPAGETRLFEGLRAGLGLDSRGRLSLERCEADTVIVLCDGATTDGPDWVARWLAEENERAQLVFHCVQIGNEGNGTLEALAEGSQGTFVRVQG